MAYEEVIEDRFRHKMPQSEDQHNRHKEVDLKCEELATYISNNLPEGREQNLALTKLEEVMFWANAGIARSNDE